MRNELYEILIEDGFSVEEAVEICDLVEYEDYTVDYAIQTVLGDF